MLARKGAIKRSALFPVRSTVEHQHRKRAQQLARNTMAQKLIRQPR